MKLEDFDSLVLELEESVLFTTSTCVGLSSRLIPLSCTSVDFISVDLVSVDFMSVDFVSVDFVSVDCFDCISLNKLIIFVNFDSLTSSLASLPGADVGFEESLNILTSLFCLVTVRSFELSIESLVRFIILDKRVSPLGFWEEIMFL